MNTIERRMDVSNYANRIQGLDADGYERGRIADTLGTKVVYNSDWGEYVVMVYVDGHRYGEGDYYTGDKADALATAKAIRDKSAGPSVSRVGPHRGDHMECHPCADIVGEMAGWLADCDADTDGLDAYDIISMVSNGYDGGIDQFLRDNLLV
jgi:hypothetical protein